MISHAQQATGLALVPGTAQEIETLEARLLGLPQCTYTQTSYFAPGVWVRELRVPRGSLIVGHEHRYANLNIMGAGQKIVLIGDKVERIVAPHCVLSGPGVRKVGLIIEDMVWYSIHHNPSNEQNEERLEELFYRKSATFTKHHQEQAEKRLLALGDLIPDFSKPSPFQQP